MKLDPPDPHPQQICKSKHALVHIYSPRCWVFVFPSNTLQSAVWAGEKELATGACASRETNNKKKKASLASAVHQSARYMWWFKAEVDEEEKGGVF